MMFVVKRYFTGGASVYKVGTREECETMARGFNDDYQTDEFVIEPFEVGRYFKGVL